MTKSIVSDLDGAVSAAREPRPFLYLEPARLPLRASTVDEAGRECLEEAAFPAVPAIVRSLVDFTIVRQNRRNRERGHAQPIQLSVLNRRRRAARSWLLAILGGKVDGGTQHAVATQWIPTLAGTGPQAEHAAHAGREFVEFVRGAITLCLFDEVADNLVPHARALAVLEGTLAVHLAAIVQAGRASAAV